MPDAQIIPFGDSAARAQNAGRTRTAERVPLPDEDDTAADPTPDVVEAPPVVAVGSGDETPELSATETPGGAPEPAKAARRPRAAAPKADGTKVRPPTARKAPAKRAPAKRAPAKQVPAKQAPAKQAPAEGAPAKRTPVKRVPAKRVPAKRVAVKAVKAVKAKPAPKAAETAPPAEIDTPIVGPPSASHDVVGRPQTDAAAAAPAPAGRASTEDQWDRRVAGALAFLRRRLTGEYETDEFGFDPELTISALAPALRPVYEKWFRVEMSGLENVPNTGGALVVANHSGTIPVDAVMLQLGLLDHHPAQRRMRQLAADLVFQMPFVGQLARKTGSTLACQPDAERLLSGGELVGVFPEGFKGVGKPFSERYKLQRFGRGGFVSAALATSAPIIPCAIVGAEEIYPKIGDAKTIARMFGLPYFPLTPTFPWLGPLGAVPLPSKWYIEFGEPIETVGLASGAEDPMQVFNLTDQVRETIQQMLYRLLMKRKSVFG
jgi:1-acyl-sn-glycerol-3-phosphate acyltransferase